MYVTPYWSYRCDETGAHHYRNTLTGERHHDGGALLSALEAVHGSAAPATPPQLAAARRLGVIFADEAAAGEWLDGWLDLQAKAFPLVDQIEMTNRCPYTCVMCPRTTAMTRSLGSMPLDLFRGIVAQLEGRQEYVALHHFGESLVHPGLPEAVAVARSAGIRTGISCNPPSLSPKLAGALLDAGIANLVLSLDSLRPERYLAIRGRAARLDTGVANLRELVRRRDAGDHDTQITAQMISMHVNADEAEEFLAFCAEAGVDRGVVIRLGAWDFTEERVGELGQYTSAGYTPPCTSPQASVAVLWDGRVVPCCHDYDGAVVLGDLRTASLAEIWAGQSVSTFRTRNGDYELCRSCMWSRWARDAQRRREGFRAFHQERGKPGERRWEWLNPVSLARHGRQWFDRFDVLTGS